jgi:predicted dehydrogenase
MMSPQKNIGLIGAGAIAQTYVRALDGNTTARIVAVADTRMEAAKSTAEIAKAEVFTSHKDLLNHDGIDAVIVSTPPSTHPEIVVPFLERGIPVLCEKPLAIDREGAHRILDAGQRSGTLVTMASKFRYVTDMIAAKALIASGALGDVLLMENAFVSPVNMAGRWNSVPAISGGGVLMDNGTHSVDITRYLLGPIAEVMAVIHNFDQRLEIEDNVQLFARTASGTCARIDLSWSFDKQLSNYVSLYGTRGTAHIGWKGSRYKLSDAADWISLGNGYDKFQAFRDNVANFCAAIDGTAAPLVTFHDAIASVEVIKAAYASAKINQWVTVESLPISGTSWTSTAETAGAAE